VKHGNSIKRNKNNRISSIDLNQKKSENNSKLDEKDRNLEYLEGEVLRLQLELSRRKGDHHTCMETCNALNSIHEGLLRFSKQNGELKLRCFYANESFRVMTGFTLPELIGRPLKWFFAKTNIHRPVSYPIYSNKKGVTLETSINTKQGNSLPVLFSIKSLGFQETSNFYEFIVLILNIRVLKSAHEQTKGLIHAERISALGHLSTGMAHEISNPLSFLLLDLDRKQELFKDIDKINSEFQKIKEEKIDSSMIKNIAQDLPQILNELNEISHATKDGLNRISEVVKTVKSYGRMDEGKSETIKLEECLNVALRLIKPKVKNRIQIIKEFTDTHPMNANPGRIVQVALNLLLNAIQAIEKEGRITVRTLEKDDQVIIEIEDTGKGIPQESLKDIFTPYFTTKTDGTGLGLGIVNNIVFDYGGTVSVQSELGVGSCFRVLFPKT
jgi:signal transduction histidine kinase